MKKLTSKIMIFVLALAVTLTMAPDIAQNTYAASGDPAITMGTEVLSTNVGDEGLQKVFFGRYYDPPTRKRDWYVIGYDGQGKNPASKENVITILHKSAWNETRFCPNSGESYANQYAASNIRWEVNSYYNGNGDWKWNNSKEKGIVVKRTLEGGGSSYGEEGYDENKIKGNSVEDAGFWLLSYGEAKVLPGYVTHVGQMHSWWLRSPGKYNHKVACCYTDWDMGWTYVDPEGLNSDNFYGVRPACDLDMNAILLTSAATGGKASGSGADALTEVGSNRNDEWKLTIKDSSRDAFDIDTCEGSYDIKTGAVTFRYKGAKVEANSYISAIILGDDNNVRYYGRVAVVSEESGNVTINTSGKMENGDKLYVFNEQYNGDNTTDYASALKEVRLPSTGPHDWVDEATCVDPKICEICGLIASPALGHQYREVEGTMVEPTCTEPGKAPDRECSRCGDVVEGAVTPATGHSWGTPRAWTSGGAIHYIYECSKCGAESEEIIYDEDHTHDFASMRYSDGTAPTCTSTGERKHYECSCGYWFEVKSDGAPADNPLNPVDFVIPVVEHEWIAATCTEPKTCENCGLTEGNPLGHYRIFTGWTWNGNEENGYTEAVADYLCIRDGCGDIRQKRITPTTRVIPPTCTECGKTVYRVQISSTDAPDITTRSDQREAKFTDPLGHEYQEVEDSAIEATCTTPGKLTDVECSRCGDVIEGETIKAPGHDWSEWTVTKPATLTKQGEKEHKCKVCGETETQATPFTIKGAKAVLSKAALTYSGKALKPSVKTIGGKTLKKGTDYTVVYSNNKNVGKAKMVITGKGKYTGTVTKTFKINPKGTPLAKLIKAKKVVTVKWKRQAAKMSSSRITGYKIQLATNKKFTKGKKTVTVKGYRNVSKKIGKLKGGKKYYVRIRTYKKIGNNTYYSLWSGVRTVTTGK